MYFIIDYCPGGDLLLQLVTKKTFSINEAKFYIAELILSIEHLHNLNIIYRDLKPENILLGFIFISFSIINQFFRLLRPY